jgi:hypothetical protein
VVPEVGLVVEPVVGAVVEPEVGAVVGAVVEPVVGASVGAAPSVDVGVVVLEESPPPSHAPRVVAKPNKSAIPRTLIFITPHFTNWGKYKF